MSTGIIQPDHRHQRIGIAEYIAKLFSNRRKPARLRYFQLFCLLTIAAISAIDIWFAVQNSSILKVEKNPICKMLLEMDPVTCKYFILGKSSGTVLVLLTLVSLVRFRFTHANLVIASVAIFQVGLFMFLTLSDPLTYNLPNFRILFADCPESIWKLK